MVKLSTPGLGAVLLLVLVVTVTNAAEGRWVYLAVLTTIVAPVAETVPAWCDRYGK
jgi:hypothetical protein